MTAKSFTSRYLRPAIEFDLNGETLRAKPTLTMAERRDEARVNYRILEESEKLRGFVAGKAQDADEGKPFDLESTMDSLEQTQEVLNEQVIVGICTLLVDDEERTRFRALAGDTDDLTLYELWAWLRREIIFAEHQFTDEHPTSA